MIAIWLEASRPKTLIASLSPVLITSLIAFKQGCLSPLIFTCALLTGIFFQIAANLANDYFDWKKGSDTHLRKGPRRAMQAGLISAKAMKKGIFLCLALCGIFTLYMIILESLLLLPLFLFGALICLGYTAGPLPLAHLGLGELAVFLVYGIIAPCMTYFLQAHELPFKVVLAGLAPGFLSCAILAANNFRDYEEDCQTGKKTLIVRFGKTFGKTEILIFFALAAAVPLALVSFFKISFWILLSLLFILPVAKDGIALLSGKKIDEPSFFIKTAKTLIIYTLLFMVGWLL